MQNRRTPMAFDNMLLSESEASEIQILYYGKHRLTFRIGTYLALIRMMSITPLVTKLYGHSALVFETHARLARTRQTVRDLICNGFDSVAGRAAIARLQEVHQHLDVNVEDFHYVLATFFLEPLRWNQRHGRHVLSGREVHLLLAFWMRLGQTMDIPNLPKQLSAWRQFQQEYEATHMRFSPEGQRLASVCLRDVVKLSLPRGMRWFFRRVMIVTTDPVVRKSLRLSGVHWYTTLFVKAFLCIAN